MIKDILSMQNIPDNFTELIYKNTSGNPLFIEELLKDIFLRKFIYINDDSGKWYKNVILKIFNCLKICMKH